MKQIISLTLSALLMGGSFSPAFAHTPKQKVSRFEIIGLIDTGLDKHFDLISKKSLSLTESEKQAVFNYKEKGALGVSISNMILGLGLGSFFSGDVTGGFIQFGGQTASLTLLSIISQISIASGRTEPSSEEKLGIFLLGLSFVAFRIYGGISPFVDAHIYNQKLKTALNMNTKVSLNNQPTINLAKLNFQF